MTYTLLIGDRAYSSWSLRGWLLFERFGIPFSTRMVAFDGAPVGEQVVAIAPGARTVPTMIADDGTVVGDSLAIAEELATRYPGAGIWPQDPSARATARWLAAEMHSGFAALREECPMNLRAAYAAAPVSGAVRDDLARIAALWADARAVHGDGGPWLCGPYSAADAFFAPVAARIAGYGLDVPPGAAAYVAAHLADPAFRRWRAMGLVSGNDLPWYARDYPRAPWPGRPTPMRAEIAEGPSQNSACPYSGKPVTHFMSIGSRTFGFCNAFCRDKSMADPLAWPEFRQIYET